MRECQIGKLRYYGITTRLQLSTSFSTMQTTPFQETPTNQQTKRKLITNRKQSNLVASRRLELSTFFSTVGEVAAAMLLAGASLLPKIHPHQNQFFFWHSLLSIIDCDCEIVPIMGCHSYLVEILFMS